MAIGGNRPQSERELSALSFELGAVQCDPLPHVFDRRPSELVGVRVFMASTLQPTTQKSNGTKPAELALLGDPCVPVLGTARMNWAGHP